LTPVTGLRLTVGGWEDWGESLMQGLSASGGNPPARAWGLLWEGSPGAYSTLILGAFGLSSLPPLSSDLESGASTGGKPLSRRQIS